jgi:hypothetical protein
VSRTRDALAVIDVPGDSALLLDRDERVQRRAGGLAALALIQGDTCCDDLADGPAAHDEPGRNPWR